MARQTTDPILDTAADLLAARGMPSGPAGVAELVKDVLAELGLEWVPDADDNLDDDERWLRAQLDAALGGGDPLDAEDEDDPPAVVEVFDDGRDADDDPGPDDPDDGRPQPPRDLEED